MLWHQKIIGFSCKKAAVLLDKMLCLCYDIKTTAKNRKSRKKTLKKFEKGIDKFEKPWYN